MSDPIVFRKTRKMGVILAFLPPRGYGYMGNTTLYVYERSNRWGICHYSFYRDCYPASEMEFASLYRDMVEHGAILTVHVKLYPRK